MAKPKEKSVDPTSLGEDILSKIISYKSEIYNLRLENKKLRNKISKFKTGLLYRLESSTEERMKMMRASALNLLKCAESADTMLKVADEIEKSLYPQSDKLIKEI